MSRRSLRRLAAVVGAAGVATALVTPAAAVANSPDTSSATFTDGLSAVDVAAPEMLAAMARDFNLDTDGVRNRLAVEDEAARVTARLDDQLGASYAGSWLTDDLDLVVAVTDRADAAFVRTLGAAPKVVQHSSSDLDQVMSKLDALPRPDADQITGWYVDVKQNNVVVRTTPGAVAAANAFIRDSGVDRAMVQLEVSADTPRTFYDVRGGDAYYPGASRCSIGFAVQGGFVTAGHCGGVGTQTSGYNQVSQGVVQGSHFPGSDMGWVSVNQNWTPQPWVNQYDGTNVIVAGSQEAPIGASVCRSGSTTQWRCGQIQAKNQTVNYPQGTVTGLTRTNACAEPGDSGGSWLSGQQAQGVTSGGSGNCSIGGTTYFQPIWPILSTYGLTLVTDGNGGGTPPPPPPPPGCEDHAYHYSSYLNGSGDYRFEPGGSYFYTTTGDHSACMRSPSTGDYDVFLQKHNSWFGWQTVASAVGPDVELELSYTGTEGNFRYVVQAYSGYGNYDLFFSTPFSG